MPARRNDSRPALAEPRRFFGEALSDLRHAGAIAGPLFRSNLRARHRRALLSYLWILLPPLVAGGVFVLLRASRVVVFAPTVLPHFLFVMAGMVLWQAFTEAVNAPLQHLKAARLLATRSTVPHEALILAGFYEVLANAGVRLVLLVGVALVMGVTLHAMALLMPLGVLALAILGISIGWVLAPVGLLYDDVGRGLAVLLSFWFFLTPVVYPQPGHWMFSLNPVAPLVTTTRSWLHAPIDARAMIAVTLAALAALVLVWLFYRLARPHVLARIG